jgi:hypothetical protein
MSGTQLSNDTATEPAGAVALPTARQCGTHTGPECLGSNVKWPWNVIE